MLEHPYITKTERWGRLDVVLECSGCGTETDNTRFVDGSPFCPTCYGEKRDELAEKLTLWCEDMGMTVSLDKALEAARIILQED